jgi:hypothetical protein
VGMGGGGTLATDAIPPNQGSYGGHTPRERRAN